MLKTRLLHPEILSALARAGHGSRVLIADGNYPAATEAPPTAQRIFLNLRPGLVAVSDVLEVLAETIPVESAMLMEPANGAPVEFHAGFRQLLGPTVSVTTRKRHEFYAEAKNAATTVVIATGEGRRFANILLTIGVVQAEPAA